MIIDAGKAGQIAVQDQRVEGSWNCEKSSEEQKLMWERTREKRSLSLSWKRGSFGEISDAGGR